MIKSLIFLLTCLSLISPAQKQSVSIQILQTHPYCGGARPTPEMEAAAREPQPYAGQKLFVISDKGAKDSVMTDAEGNFKISLKPGIYKVYEPWKFHKQTPNGEAKTDYNMDCLKKEWKKEDLKITITNKAKPEVINNLTRGKCPWQQDCLLKKQLPE
ncbi:MAG: hypothetical protein ACXVPQ_00900 [Bacteroidia bacterium]